MEYAFVTRSIPTLWKGCYLLVARALPPVVFMAQHLRSVIHSMEFVGLRSYNFVGLRLVLYSVELCQTPIVLEFSSQEF